MEESILTSIKETLGGLTEECTQFDNQIIMHINTVFSELVQMGVGPKDGFKITNGESRWEDFIADNQKIEMVKSFVYLKVRLLFDPPTSGILIESMDRQIKELEFRLYSECNFKDEEVQNE